MHEGREREGRRTALTVLVLSEAYTLESLVFQKFALDRQRLQACILVWAWTQCTEVRCQRPDVPYSKHVMNVPVFHSFFGCKTRPVRMCKSQTPMIDRNLAYQYVKLKATRCLRMHKQAGTRARNHQRHTYTLNASPPTQAKNATRATNSNPPRPLYKHLTNTPLSHHTAPCATEAPQAYQ